MTRKVINLNNYVCSRYAWITAMIPSGSLNYWQTLRDENPRLWKWIDPPDIDPLRYFFRIDAGNKGWVWSSSLENCYGFLMTYYINSNLIIMTAGEPGGTEEMVNEKDAPVSNNGDVGNDLPQPASGGIIPVNWNIPFLAEFDNSLTKLLNDLGLGINSWVVYLLLGTLVYIKVK